MFLTESQTMKIRQISVLLIFLLINGLIVWTLFGNKEEEKDENEKKSLLQYYEADYVKNQTHIAEITSYGQIKGATSFDLSSEVQGKLLQGNVRFKPGIKFTKGQVLCRVDNTDALYNLSARKASFITLIANALPDLRIDFPDEFEKWKSYMDRLTLNRPIPDLPAWSSDKEKVFLASRNIISEYFGIKGNENTISKYTLTAPFNGMIHTTFVDINANVSPGVRLATLVETKNFEMKAPFRLEEMPYINLGKTGQLTNNKGEVIGMATVDRISEIVNQNTQSVDVYLKVAPTENGYFYDGMFANLQIPTDSIYQSFELPRRAVHDDSVYVFMDSSLFKKHVTIARKKSNSIIIKGLNDGELVVTNRVEKYIDTLKSVPILR